MTTNEDLRAQLDALRGQLYEHETHMVRLLLFQSKRRASMRPLILIFSLLVICAFASTADAGCFGGLRARGRYAPVVVSVEQSPQAFRRSARFGPLRLFRGKLRAKFAGKFGC
jgi:hypothetical protein